MALPEGTVTFLRSDIEGSMELVRALGARYDDLNAVHQGLVRAAVAEHAGHVVRTEGDAFFVVFTDAGAAARTAVNIQRAMADHAWPVGHQFKVRIGIHAGAATRAGDDYGGFEVNRAARIAAMGWGGQVILSDPARALIMADLPEDWSIRNLGPHQLKGVLQPERIFQLDARGLTTAFPELRTAASAAQHLPARVTSFIGREAELEALSALLADTRLLTLTGPGGTGKTTLALELARRHASDYADGTWFVDLQTVRDPSLLKAEIAHGLDMYDGAAGPAADRLIDYISGQDLLVVLDNFEQIIDAADVVGEMLRASPRTCVIVTSRVPLRLGAEQEYAVHPLGLGGTDAGGEPEAVRLFVDRLRRVRPRDTLDGEGLDTVRETCRLLDGLPLAIELTAARASALPLGLIRDRLEKRLPLPGSGPRDLPDRQQTIEATVAWSYELLDPPLQRLFARLAVFVDSFDLEQAEDVAGPADEIGVDALDGIFQLTEQSLLRRVDDAVGGVRFGMLETIRAQALLRLRERGDEASIRERHARAYASLAEQVAGHLAGPGQNHWIDRMEPDGANLRAAAIWAVESGHVELAVGCAAVPWRFWLVSGLLSTGTALIGQSLALCEAETQAPLRLIALEAAGGVTYWSGDLQAANARYEQQLSLADELADGPGRARALLNLSFSRSLLKGAGAAEAQAEACRLFKEQGDEDALLMVEWSRTLNPAMWESEQVRITESQKIVDRLEQRGGAWYAAMALTTRSLVAFMDGRHAASAEYGLESLRIALVFNDFARASFNIEPFVGFLAWSGEAEAAAVTLGGMELIWQRNGIRPPAPIWKMMGAPDPVPQVREALGPDRFDAAIAQGRRLSEEELLDHIEAALGRIPADAVLDIPRQAPDA